MTVERKGIGILPENDRGYFSLLEGVIESVDSEAGISITKNPTHYHLRIVPSDTRTLSFIIEAVIALNKQMGIQLSLSKSMKSSATVSFQIPL